MYTTLFIILVILPIILIFFAKDIQYKNTRKLTYIRRRYLVDNYTSIAKKSVYIKEVVEKLLKNNVSLNIGNIANEMNRLEFKYRLPYNWRRDIRDIKEGFDCTGFIHGLMYYTKDCNCKKRFNIFSLYKKLLKDRDYIILYCPRKNSIDDLDLSTLKFGDIVIWSRGVMDAKNLQVSSIFGHIGVVSSVINQIPYVTHYVRSDAYNNIDIFPLKGAGNNTLNIKRFITLKKR